MKRLDYVSPEIESIKLYSDDQINTAGPFDINMSNGEVSDGSWD